MEDNKINYIGIKFIKNNYNQDEYAKVAKWCMETNEATIEDKGEYFLVTELKDFIKSITPETEEDDYIENDLDINNQNEISELVSKSFFDMNTRLEDIDNINEHLLAKIEELEEKLNEKNV